MAGLEGKTPQIKLTRGDGKAEGNDKGWIGKWIPVALGLAGVLAILIVFVSPIIAGVVASASQKGLLEYLNRLINADPLSLWRLASEYEAWEKPAVITCILFCAICVGASIYFAEEIRQNNRRYVKNIFGPSAESTNSKGSARIISDPSLIEEINETCNNKEDNLPPYGSLVLGCMEGRKKHEQKLILAPYEAHCLVVGQTGSGKSQLINIPTIWAMANAKEKCSAIILDNKGELYNLSSRYVRELGIKTMCIDFRNPELSWNIDPLKPVKDAFFDKLKIHDEEMEKAYEIASECGITGESLWDDKAWARTHKEEKFIEFQTHIKRASAAKRAGWAQAEARTRDIALCIIRDIDGQAGSEGPAHWLDIGRSALETTILLQCTYTTKDYRGDKDPWPEPYPEQRTLPGVLAMLRKYSSSEKDGQAFKQKFVSLMEEIDPEHPAVKAFSPIAASQEKDISTTLSEALKFITKLISGELEMILGKSDIDYKEIAREQTFLYLIVPSDRPAAGRLFVLLFKQIYQTLVDEAVKNGGRLNMRVCYLLEEFGSICKENKIDNLDDMLMMSRGYNMALYITVQNLSQLAKIYDKHTLNTILDNCRVKELLKTSDVEGTAEYFSKSIGSYTVITESLGKNRDAMSVMDRAKTKSFREDMRKYYTEDELTRWVEEFGSIVLQSRPGKNPNYSKHAKKLGWTGVMYPMVIPTKRAYQIDYVSKAFCLDDKNKLQRNIEEIQASDRTFTRPALIPWNLEGKSIVERETTRAQLYDGGISLEAKRALARTERDKKLQETARDMLYSSVDVEKIKACGLSQADEIVKALCERFYAESASAIPKVDEAGNTLNAKTIQTRKMKARQSSEAIRQFVVEGIVEIITTEKEPEWYTQRRRASKQRGDSNAAVLKEHKESFYPKELKKKSNADSFIDLEASFSQNIRTPEKKNNYRARPESSAWCEEMRTFAKEALNQATDPLSFQRVLAHQYQIKLEFPNEVEIVYHYQGRSFKGSKIGRAFTQEGLRAHFKKKEKQKEETTCSN